MRSMMLVTILSLALGCGRNNEKVNLTKALHTATAKDTAFVRANCAMPDSVLAGVRSCIDRVQSSKVRVF